MQLGGMKMGGGMPSGGNPYGRLNVPGLPGRQGMSSQVHPITASLFGHLVRNTGRNIGAKLKVPGQVGKLGLPFHTTSMSGGIGGGQFRKPMFGGMANQRFRI